MTRVDHIRSGFSLEQIAFLIELINHRKQDLNNLAPLGEDSLYALELLEKANKTYVAPDPEEPLKPFHFRCPNCKKVHRKSGYCVAQQASGHGINFECDCGNTFTVPEERE